MNAVNFSELFDLSLVFYDLEVKSKEEFLEKVSIELETKKYVKNSYKDAIKARELKYPTGLQTEIIKVAIPHTDPEHVNKSVISIARLNKPVQFNEMGNHDQTVDVELVFTLALNDGKNHLGVIQRLIGLFSNGEVMKKLKKSDNKEDLLNVILESMYI
ncbi:PTS sugar transporter subunit IIA [Cytobacillus gottheilii]|uniref:PTS sugar transporter subunit IIA n=1 Tax=Cytobacillus gottheilii TaxID=859144 RepID=UPI0015932650|nr:PTS sugar transporter subunit IIA [Cytobacillus gottheilii]